MRPNIFKIMTIIIVKSKKRRIFVLSKPNNMKKSTKSQRRQIFQNQIFRLAKIYLSRKASVENLEWHSRVLQLQVAAIKDKKAVK